MRPRKEPRESFGSTLKQDLMDNLRQLSVNTSVPISKLLDQAVELLMEKRGATRDTNRTLGADIVKVADSDKVADKNQPYRIDVKLSEEDKKKI